MRMHVVGSDSGSTLPQDIRYSFAYTRNMPRLYSPVEVLTVLIQRTEKRIQVLKNVRLESYSYGIWELEKMLLHLNAARDYLNSLR
jgi:hypothetical protein